MGFQVIDLDRWPRRPYFEHYMQDARCTYSMTVQLDIARLLRAAKGGGYKLYPTLIYVLARCVNAHEAFRYGWDTGGRLGLWDEVHPSYTVFHEDDHTFSSLWTPYQERFSAFYADYIQDQAAYGDVHAFLGKPNEPPNAFPVSGMPWAHFTAMNLNMFTEGTYLAPIFTIGQFIRQGEQVLLPLAIQAHHAVCDGYHVGAFLKSVQEMIEGPAAWMA